MLLLVISIMLLLPSCATSESSIQTPSSPDTAPNPYTNVDEIEIASISPLDDETTVEIEEDEEPPYIPIEAIPIWMYIPAINVDAEIQGTETDFENSTMHIVHSGSIISWWKDSAIPGNTGNAIFASHNIWSGRSGQLHDLDTLEIGDEMEILYDDGTREVFRLESVFVYLLATAPGEKIMDTTGEARVTLITCKAPFNYNTGTSDNRIVAVFKPEESFIIPDPPIEPFPPRES